MDRVHVQVQGDHLEKLTRPSRRHAGLTELIWNGLDAEAHKVSVSVAENDLGGVAKVIVADDGHGMTREECLLHFSSLGGSWKRSAPGKLSRNKLRLMHGSEGQGRWRAFSIGSYVRWVTVAETPGGRQKTVVTGKHDSLTDFEVSEAELTSDPVGTRVEMENIHPIGLGLLGEKVVETLTAEFALYIERYSVHIAFRGVALDPEALQAARDELLVEFDTEHGAIELTVIEWKKEFPRAMLLCDSNGSIVGELPPGVQAPGLDFTVYARWEGFRTYESELALADMGNPNLSPAVDAIRSKLRVHFRARIKDRTAKVIEAWKEDDVYPYKGNPASPVEKAERDLFDVVALSAAQTVNGAGDVPSRRLSLRLLKEAVETNPGSLHRVLKEVLDLPVERLDELTKLLDRTSLADIISAAHTVASRLDFLQAMETLLFETENRKTLLERTQLHRILATETWIFGDEYTLAVDDEPLTQVLRKHLGLMGRTDLASAVDDRVLTEDGVNGIVDLMLSRAIELPRSREHLVVELKRPSVKVGSDELTQIEKYAFAIAADERFANTSTRWEFWVISNDLAPYGKIRANQRDKPQGLAFEGSNFNIWVRTWGQVIEDCRRRLRFVQQSLDYQSTKDHAVEYLRSAHAKYLPESLASIDERQSA
jgi:Histidine kinase-, DNA gyrase B-, and HSP90-like ATPase